MHRLVVGATVASLTSIACASGRIRAQSHVLPRVPTKARSQCGSFRGTTREGLLAAMEADPWVMSGEPTLTKLDVLRRVVVQVNDYYFDSARIEPTRMLTAMVDALAKRSEGFLRVESDHLVTAMGDRWPMPVPKSIWEIPMAIRDLGYFLVKKLPPGHRLAAGHFSELVMTNGLLATLDPDSILLSPKVWAPFHEPGAAGAAAQPDSSIAGPSPLRNGFTQLNAGAILHVRPGWFGRGSAEGIRAGVEKASAMGASGLVLDLRGHRGGLLEATLEVADLFLATGTMVTLNGRSSAQTTSAVNDGIASERLKVIVLVDSATSSGAEILAGALRFGDRALLIGQPTSGDGLIQVVYDFPSPGSSSGALKLSIAEALLPGDRSFDGLGIAPDLEVTSNQPTQRTAADACAPVGETLAKISPAIDQPDPVVALAARVLAMAPTARRTDLLAAAKAVAASSPE